MDNYNQQPPSLQKPINPYQAPTSSMEVATQYDNELIEPQSLSAGSGVSWISDAWQIFRGNIGLWIISGIIMLVISVIVSFIPVVQIVSGALNVFFIAGVGYMAHRYVVDEPISIGDLFIGFQKNAMPLFLIFILGTVAIIAIVVVMVILAMVFGMGFSAMRDPGSAGGLMVLLMVLLGLAMLIPVSMAMFFSPILVILNDVPAVEAMKLSFSGCIRNILPFLVFGLVMMVLGIVAMIPLGLGLLVVVPLYMICVYTSYRQIFTRV